jgi:thiamine pyrophosphokinase
MKGFIFANGEYCSPEPPPEIQPDDLVIAADGGSRHCLAVGILPDILIGDLDSTAEILVNQWRASGVEIIRHPQDKDQTDLELAMLAAQSRGVTEIVVYGAVGGRLDMTFGNLLLLAHPDLSTPVTLICGNEEVHLLHSGETLTLQGNPGEIVSLLPLHSGASVVTTQGLQYPLSQEDLVFGYTRGISNCLVNSRGTIHLDEGLLAVIHIREENLEDN